MEITRKSKKRGPQPLESADKRTCRKTVFFTEAELETVVERAGGKNVPAFLRATALGKKHPRRLQIPVLNREAWVSLARLAGNLNQISHNLHLAAEGQIVAPEVKELAMALAEFRAALMGQNLFSVQEADEEEDS